MVAPDNIWIAGLLDECGAYYSSAVEAEGDHGGTAVEYVRITPDTIPLPRAEVEALIEAARAFQMIRAVWTDPHNDNLMRKVSMTLDTLQEHMK